MGFNWVQLLQLISYSLLRIGNLKELNYFFIIIVIINNYSIVYTCNSIIIYFDNKILYVDTCCKLLKLNIIFYFYENYLCKETGKYFNQVKAWMWFV